MSQQSRHPTLCCHAHAGIAEESRVFRGSLRTSNGELQDDWSSKVSLEAVFMVAGTITAPGSPPPHVASDIAGDAGVGRARAGSIWRCSSTLFPAKWSVRDERGADGKRRAADAGTGPGPASEPLGAHRSFGSREPVRQPRLSSAARCGRDRLQHEPRGNCWDTPWSRVSLAR